MLRPTLITLSALTLILLLAILITISFNLSNFSLTSLSIFSQEANYQNFHAWTKAICTKDNFCHDYLIECQDQEPIKLTPITGASIQFDSLWQDPRSLEQRERLCD
ncbi:hypothetical protein HYT23_04280 [Candidatus Pacearchaeota archaeon]|nr:hypothetical protein [Candidatus Pacearchaeota archaeon]